MEREGHRGNFANQIELFISAVAFDHMRSHITQHMPFESGGLLTGARVSSHFVIEEFLPLNVVMPSYSRYVSSARDTVKTILWADRNGKRIVGTIHSHPGGSNCPSEIDLDNAYGYKNMIHLIAYPSHGQVSFSAFYYYLSTVHVQAIDYEEIAYTLI